MTVIHVDVAPPRHELRREARGQAPHAGDVVRYEAVLRDEGATASGGSFPATERLWIDVPESQAELVTTSAEPFVRALLFAFMQRGRPVRVHGSVSPTLLRNLEELMHIWHAWHPERFEPVAIRADDESPRAKPPFDAPAVASFSGGIDSCYTMWRQTQGLVDRRRVNLQAAAFGCGLDLHRRHADEFRSAAERYRGMLRELGVELLTFETNFRELQIDGYSAFGSIVAGCLSLFAKAYPVALLPSGCGYANLLVPHATSPVTDHLYDGDDFRLHYDGGELLRPEKTGVVAEWAEAGRQLRVCWQGPVPFENCGECEKCLRTILAYWLHGHSTPEAFPRAPELGTIRSARLASSAAVMGFQNLIDRGMAAGKGDEPWVRAARAAVRRNSVINDVRDRTRGVRMALRGMKRRIGGGSPTGP